MARHFIEDLNRLQDQMLEMAGLVETGIHSAVESLVQRSEPLAQEVLVNEGRINQLEIEIDDGVMQMLALQSPVASDLRLVRAIGKIGTDLERMGDMAVNIVERSLALIRQPAVKPLIDIPQMANLTEFMVRSSIDSFVRRNAELARGVLVSDDAVDDLRDTVYKDLMDFMQNDPSTIPAAINLMFVARNLERIADHATNIAEDTLFLIEGVDVRHARPHPRH